MTKNYILFFLQLIRFGVKNVSPFKFLDKEPQIIFLFRKERDSTTILIVITGSKQKKTKNQWEKVYNSTKTKFPLTSLCVN